MLEPASHSTSQDVLRSAHHATGQRSWTHKWRQLRDGRRDPSRRLLDRVDDYLRGQGNPTGLRQSYEHPLWTALGTADLALAPFDRFIESLAAPVLDVPIAAPRLFGRTRRHWLPDIRDRCGFAVVGPDSLDWLALLIVTHARASQYGHRELALEASFALHALLHQLLPHFDARDAAPLFLKCCHRWVFTGDAATCRPARSGDGHESRLFLIRQYVAMLRVRSPTLTESEVAERIFAAFHCQRRDGWLPLRVALSQAASLTEGVERSVDSRRTGR